MIRVCHPLRFCSLNRAIVEPTTKDDEKMTTVADGDKPTTTDGDMLTTTTVGVDKTTPTSPVATLPPVVMRNAIAVTLTGFSVETVRIIIIYLSPELNTLS